MLSLEKNTSTYPLEGIPQNALDCFPLGNKRLREKLAQQGIIAAQGKQKENKRLLFVSLKKTKKILMKLAQQSTARETKGFFLYPLKKTKKIFVSLEACVSLRCIFSFAREEIRALVF